MEHTVPLNSRHLVAEWSLGLRMNEKQRQTYFTEFATFGESKVRHMVEMKTWLPHDSYHHNAAKEWLLIQDSLSKGRSESREASAARWARHAAYAAYAAAAMAAISIITTIILSK